MPELPEVETVRRGLQELIVGLVVVSESHDTPKGFPNTQADVEGFLIGSTITLVRRRAKLLLIDLSSSYTLMIHLKMTGQLVFVGHKTESTLASLSEHTLRGAKSSPVAFGSPTATVSSIEASMLSAGDTTALPVANSHIPFANSDEVRFGAGHPSDSLVSQLPDKSTRVTLTFTDGSHLFFNDQRKFGWMKLLPTAEIENVDFMKKVGPEPLEADFTPEQFAERFTRRANTSIKAALLDQSVIAGVGNIYADESLWGAKIHPKTLVRNIPIAIFHILYTELRSVMNLAIEKGGSSNHTYINAEGKKGSYMDFARVFRREGLECPRCGAVIVKFKAAGRGTHICPNCQVL